MEWFFINEDCEMNDWKAYESLIKSIRSYLIISMQNSRELCTIVTPSNQYFYMRQCNINFHPLPFWFDLIPRKLIINLVTLLTSRMAQLFVPNSKILYKQFSSVPGETLIFNILLFINSIIHRHVLVYYSNINCDRYNRLSSDFFTKYVARNLEESRLR